MCVIVLVLVYRQCIFKVVLVHAISVLNEHVRLAMRMRTKED